MSFEGLGLGENLLRAVKEQQFKTPTPVQREAIPMVLAGHDLLAGAQTGTGKTAGFVLPILEKLEAEVPNKGRRAIRALVVTPTRELALQVESVVVECARFTRLRATSLFGGVKPEPQIEALEHGVDFVIATPGRLLDHAGQGNLDLSTVEVFVLDEADRMLDMGFRPDVDRILKLLPRDRQNLLFSATFSREVKELAGRFLKDPVYVEVDGAGEAAEMVSQAVIFVDKKRKRELLSSMIRENGWDRVLIFTRTKYGANRLTRQLAKDGIPAAVIHGNKSQGARTRALSGFKEGEIQALVATDIAARGLDISGLPHVVNYELPFVADDYVHRIGRTGRAGEEGAALSLVCVDELGLLEAIEERLGQEIEGHEITGFEVDRTIQPEPLQRGRRHPMDQVGRHSGRGGPREGGSSRDEGRRSRGRDDRHSVPSERQGRKRTEQEGPRTESRRTGGRRPEGRRSESRRTEGRHAESRPPERRGAQGKGRGRTGGGGDDRGNRRAPERVIATEDDFKWNRREPEAVISEEDDFKWNRIEPEEKAVVYVDEFKWNRIEPEEEISEEDDFKWNRIEPERPARRDQGGAGVRPSRQRREGGSRGPRDGNTSGNQRGRQRGGGRRGGRPGGTSSRSGGNRGGRQG